MAGLNTGRLAAGRALLAVLGGAHLDEAPDGALSAEDRALALHLAAGVLRRQGELDLALAPHCRRGKLDPAVRVALRIGAFERLFSRTAAHAAVDQAVRLCRALGSHHAAGFVNAVLRKLTTAADAPPTANHPDWLVARWRARYGAEATDALCAVDDRAPPLAIAALREPARVLADFAAAGLTLRPARVGGSPQPGSFWLDGAHGSVAALPGYAEGRWVVMDPSAAAVASLLPCGPGTSVLDACAAPGGKTLCLAARGASVTATDRSERRLGRLHENLARCGLQAEVRVVDWLDAPPPGTFDAALLDAPCTGLGTLRRHPEIRWSRLPSDPLAMAIPQAALLRAIAARVRPGGALVYAVCSPEPEESTAIVLDFLKEFPQHRLEEELVVAPNREDEDLHYAARLRLGEGP